MHVCMCECICMCVWVSVCEHTYVCLSECVCVHAPQFSGVGIKIYVRIALLPVDAWLAPLRVTSVCSNVTQFMFSVGSRWCCDTEQLRTPKLGRLPGVLHCGRQPRYCRLRAPSTRYRQVLPQTRPGEANSEPAMFLLCNPAPPWTQSCSGLLISFMWFRALRRLNQFQ